jgi:ribosome-associated translation inhibitor RaiA
MTRIDMHGVTGDQALKTYVEQRIRFWIGHLERDLEVVTVCLAVEGSRVGPHTRCRMIARPVRWADVVVEETDTDPYAAIDRSAERLADLVAFTRLERAGQPYGVQPDTGAFCR